MKTQCPVDVPEIERLMKEFSGRLRIITGCEPDIDIWFHYQGNDTRSLAHDAVNCGYRVKRIHDYENPSTVSHISVQKPVVDVGKIMISIQPRKAASDDHTFSG